jgi:hypothetical protein
VENLDVIGVAMFAVATVVALVVRRRLVPYTVGLVVAGLVLGATQVLRSPHLTKELLFARFLPGLLFEAAFPRRQGALTTLGITSSEFRRQDRGSSCIGDVEDDEALTCARHHISAGHSVSRQTRQA